MLKLLKRTLVNRAYQLTRTLLFPARAETVESTSSTVEDGGRERSCGLDVNQSLSQPTKYIHSRRRVELNHVEKQTNSCDKLYISTKRTFSSLFGERNSPLFFVGFLGKQNRMRPIFTGSILCNTKQQRKKIEAAVTSHPVSSTIL